MLKVALEIIKFINSRNFEAYIVGGFVRDYLLNIISEDIDIATNMPKDLLSKYFKVNNNEYGSFVLQKDSYFFEVTLFRKELSYEKQRHPIVQLVDTYKEDFVRRDFTINALGFDCNMNLIDYCNGKVDLDNKILTTIREPNLTFKEDPVRILRAIYFKNKLNLSYQNNTYQAILDNIYEVKSISNNRLITELTKMSYNLDLYIKDIIDTKLYEYIIFNKALLFIYRNKIRISNINQLFEIHYLLTNSLDVEIDSTFKKDIINYVSLTDVILCPRVVFDISLETYIKTNEFNKLIKKRCLLKEFIFLKDSLTIKSIKDIDFDLKQLKEYIDVKKINETKDLIIDNILNGFLDNTYEEIIKFINNL